ncbi:MAG: hypothetical protein EBS69_10490 [Verrucomicrobia bacterium]|nr:hypothetical protein [Verrucomicrobiota bacterium]
MSAELVEIRAELEPGQAEQIVFNVRGAKVTYDAKTGHLVVNGHRAPAPMRDGRVRLAIYCDRTGIEAFAADGLCYLPQPFQPPAENRSFLLEVQGGAVKIPRLEVYELKSIWGKS